jgi:hypothetical protein
VTLVAVTESVRFERLSGAALDEWLQASRAAYVAERIEAGDSPHEAEANAAASFERQVPGGKLRPGQHVGLVVDAGGAKVGHLWVGPLADDPARWWV